MSVKNNLKEIRMKEYGMERKEFAEFLNVNLKTYYGWESGERVPPLEKCLEVSNILNKSVNEVWYIK